MIVAYAPHIVLHKSNWLLQAQHLQHWLTYSPVLSDMPKVPDGSTLL